MKYHKLAFLVAAMLFTATLNAQNSVAIGAPNPDPNAVLLLVGSGTQGLIIPIATDITTMPKKAGMIVYFSGKVYSCDGTTWTAVGGSASASQSISISGNTITVGTGTSSTPLATVSGSLTAGQFFMWNGSAWAATTLTGDISNTNGAITVNNIKGKAVPNFAAGVLTSDANGVLSWTTPTGSVPTLANGQILTGNGSLNSATTLGGDATLSGGNLTINKLGGQVYTFPTSNTTAGVLTNASGTLTWGPVSISGVTAGGDLTGNYPNPTISKISSLSTNGLIKTSGGTGALSIATAGTDYVVTEADPVVKSINGLVKGTGTSIVAATAGTDYLVPFGSQSAKFVYAAPNAAAGIPSFRALVASDIPTLNQNTTGSAGSVANALTVDNSSIQLSSGTTYNGSSASTISVKALGITNAMLAGSIASSKLVGTDIATVGTITTGKWNGTVISEAFGGTNQTGYAAGDILYASTPTTLSKLAIGSPGQVLTINAGGTAPFWSTAAGSSFSTLNAIPKGNGSGLTVSSITDDGSTVTVTNPGGNDLLALKNTGSSTYGTLGIDGVIGSYLSMRQGGVQTAFMYSLTGGTFLGTQGAANLGFMTNGTTKMTISSAGSVGIGNGSPLAKLDVLGAGVGVQLLSGSSTSYTEYVLGRTTTDGEIGVAGAAGDYSTDAAAGDIVIRTGGKLLLQSGSGNSAIAITTSKNVGIGTATPVSKLDVSGDIHLTQLSSAPSPTTDKLYNFGGNLFWNGTNISSGGSSFSTNNVIPKGNGTTLTSSLLYDNGTNVGIGTTTPTNKLDVQGSLASPSSAISATNNGTGNGISGSSANGGIGVYGYSSSGYGIEGSSNTGTGINGSSTNSIGINAYSVNSIGIQATTGSASSWAGYFSGNVAMLGGNVGIGTASPLTKLDVQGGDINTNGEVNRTSTGSANLVPIAYGSIDQSGTILNGTGNFSATFSSSANGYTYTITITGETYSLNNYIANVTTLSTGCTSNPPLANSSANSGSLSVYVFAMGGGGGGSTTTPCGAFSGIHFIVYKP